MALTADVTAYLDRLHRTREDIHTAQELLGYAHVLNRDGQGVVSPTDFEL